MWPSSKGENVLEPKGAILKEPAEGGENRTTSSGTVQQGKASTESHAAPSPGESLEDAGLHFKNFPNRKPAIAFAAAVNAAQKKGRFDSATSLEISPPSLPKSSLLTVSKTHERTERSTLKESQGKIQQFSSVKSLSYLPKILKVKESLGLLKPSESAPQPPSRRFLSLAERGDKVSDKKHSETSPKQGKQVRKLKSVAAVAAAPKEKTERDSDTSPIQKTRLVTRIRSLSLLSQKLQGREQKNLTNAAKEFESPESHPFQNQSEKFSEATKKVHPAYSRATYPNKKSLRSLVLAVNLLKDKKDKSVKGVSSGVKRMETRRLDASLGEAVMKVQEESHSSISLQGKELLRKSPQSRIKSSKFEELLSGIMTDDRKKLQEENLHPLDDATKKTKVSKRVKGDPFKAAPYPIPKRESPGVELHKTVPPSRGVVPPKPRKAHPARTISAHPEPRKGVKKKRRQKVAPSLHFSSVDINLEPELPGVKSWKYYSKSFAELKVISDDLKNLKKELDYYDFFIGNFIAQEEMEQRNFIGALHQFCSDNLQEAVPRATEVLDEAKFLVLRKKLETLLTQKKVQRLSRGQLMFQTINEPLLSHEIVPAYDFLEVASEERYKEFTPDAETSKMIRKAVKKQKHYPYRVLAVFARRMIDVGSNVPLPQMSVSQKYSSICQTCTENYLIIPSLKEEWRPAELIEYLSERNVNVKCGRHHHGCLNVLKNYIMARTNMGSVAGFKLQCLIPETVDSYWEGMLSESWQLVNKNGQLIWKYLGIDTANTKERVLMNLQSEDEALKKEKEFEFQEIVKAFKTKRNAYFPHAMAFNAAEYEGGPEVQLDSLIFPMHTLQSKKLLLSTGESLEDDAEQYEESLQAFQQAKAGPHQSKILKNALKKAREDTSLPNREGSPLSKRAVKSTKARFRQALVKLRLVTNKPSKKDSTEGISISSLETSPHPKNPVSNHQVTERKKPSKKKNKAGNLYMKKKQGKKVQHTNSKVHTSN